MIQVRFWWIVTGLFLVSCAVGIDPPDPTTLVYLEGGSFEMGTRTVDPCGRFYREDCSGITCKTIMPADDPAESERISHALAVDSFCLDEHEVTIDQYRHCVARGDCPRPVVSNAGDDLLGEDDSFIARYWNDPDKYGDHPVLGVSWAGAQAYCRSRGGRLPTEVEWEFAARSRGEDHGPEQYIWSDPDLARNIDLGCGDYQQELAVGPCSRSVRPVKASAADRTAQGVYDLAGNVAEWTSDFWSPISYCAASQPGGLSLEDIFTVDAQGRVTPIPTGSLLRSQNDDCLEVDESGTDYSGARRRDFGECTRLTEVDADAVVTRVGECFEAFDADSCLVDGVRTVCGRLPSDRGQCVPTPWCVARTEAPAAVLPSVITEEASAQFVVRGAHFQSTAACETRPTARRGLRLGDALVGFRCRLPDQHARCRTLATP